MALVSGDILTQAAGQCLLVKLVPVFLTAMTQQQLSFHDVANREKRFFLLTVSSKGMSHEQSLFP